MGEIRLPCLQAISDCLVGIGEVFNITCPSNNGLRPRETTCLYQHKGNFIFRLKQTLSNSTETITSDSFGDGRFIDPDAPKSCSFGCGCRSIDSLEEQRVFSFVIHVVAAKSMTVEVHSSELLLAIEDVCNDSELILESEIDGAIPFYDLILDDNAASFDGVASFDGDMLLDHLPDFIKKIEDLKETQASVRSELMSLLTIGLASVLSLNDEFDKLWRLESLPSDFRNLIETRFPQFALNTLEIVGQFSMLHTENLNRSSNIPDQEPSNEYAYPHTEPKILSDALCQQQETLFTIESILTAHRWPKRFNFWGSVLSEFAQPGRQRLQNKGIVRDVIHRAFLKLCANDCWMIIGKALESRVVNDLVQHEELRSHIPREYLPKYNLNYLGVEDKTPLMMGSFSGHIRVVKKLLSYSARTDIVDHSGKTALIMAVENGHIDIVEQLLWSEANPNHITLVGDTCLSIASLNNRRDMIGVLLSHGANPDMCLAHGATPLMIAIRHGYRSIANMLLDANADPNVVTANGTALGIAVRLRDKKSVYLLSKRGADRSLALCSLTNSGSRSGASKFIEKVQTDKGIQKHIAFRKLRAGFINTFNKLSRRVLEITEDKSRIRLAYLSSRTWWQRGVRTIQGLMEGHVPASVLQILRVFLVIGSIASVMDDFDQEGIRPCINSTVANDAMTRAQHYNLLYNGHLEMFKHDIDRWMHVLGKSGERTRLRAWTMDLWGESNLTIPWKIDLVEFSPDVLQHFIASIQVYISSAESLFGFNLGYRLTNFPTQQESSPSQSNPQHLHCEDTEQLQSNPQLLPSDVRNESNPHDLFCEEPPDPYLIDPFSIREAAYLMAGATFTILFLFLQVLQDDLNHTSLRSWGSTALQHSHPILYTAFSSVVGMAFTEKDSTPESRALKEELHMLATFAIERWKLWNILTLYNFFQYMPLEDAILSNLQKFCQSRYPTYLMELNNHLLCHLLGKGSNATRQDQPRIYDIFNELEASRTHPSQRSEPIRDCPTAPSDGSDASPSGECSDSCSSYHNYHSTTCRSTHSSTSPPSKATIAAESKQPFYCEIHNCSFANKSNYNRHLRERHGSQFFSCGKCGKDFKRSDLLKRHKISSRGQVCDKVINRRRRQQKKNIIIRDCV
ncbi:hypothetical protein GGI43DRAFT_226330 [Trichoderma evansii]